MKRILFCALLLTSYAQAGELLPMSGEQSEHMQRAIDTHLRPAVEAAGDIKVEPILESIDIAGRGKRLFLGPIAGGSHVVLRVRITDGEEIREEVFSAKGGAWRGTFLPGRDYEMLKYIAEQAAEFIREDERTAHLEN